MYFIVIRISGLSSEILIIHSVNQKPWLVVAMFVGKLHLCVLRGDKGFPLSLTYSRNPKFRFNYAWVCFDAVELLVIVIPFQQYCALI